MKLLKLAQLADISQIVASVAVVVSLIYVGIQVSDNASAVRSAAANDAAVAMQNWYLEVGGNRQTSDLFINSMRGTGDLSVEDEFQYLMIQHAGFLGLQNSFLLREEGTLDPSIAASITAIILGVKDLPGFDLYWRQRKDYLHPGFVEYVEQLREQKYEGSTDICRATDRSRVPDETTSE
jgi:hypothetical protein